ELLDIGRDPKSEAVLEKLRGHLSEWSMRHHAAWTTPTARRMNSADSECSLGVLIGFYDEHDVRNTKGAIHPLS
ncbi:MAG: hypothetical protein WBC85_06085, partial [Planktotalea sp.]